jgi:K+-sensing histidine kinase KdpD
MGTLAGGDEGREDLFYFSVGPLVAILLGMLLVPLRGFTTASNFTFAFLAITIVVAELGGRWAAVATALTSALSLDFFLTQPYLRLSIDDKHDIIAFVGLAACGLIAAALGAPRRSRIAARETARRQLDLLHAVVAQLDRTATLEARLADVLKACRGVLPVAALVVRDARDRILAATGPETEARPIPGQVLQLDDSQPPGSPASRTFRPRLPLPLEGTRVPLMTRERQVGWLDLWGNGVPASSETRRLLLDVARLVAVLLAGRDTLPRVE